jgi:hypothetical protein
MLEQVGIKEVIGFKVVKRGNVITYFFLKLFENISITAPVGVVKTRLRKIFKSQMVCGKFSR